MEELSNFYLEYGKVIWPMITGLSVLYGYVQRLKRKRIEEKEYDAATRLGDIECGFTTFTGPEQRMELLRPQQFDIENLIPNPRLRQEFLAASNDPVELSPFGNIGFLRMKDAKRTKSVMLRIRSQYEGMLAAFSPLVAAGVPTRKVVFLIGVRRDSYATAFEADGFQTYRAIAVLKEEVLRTRANAEAWKASKTVLVDYQRDRLEHIVQMATLYGSSDEVEQQMVTELEVRVPELFYQQLNAEYLEKQGEKPCPVQNVSATA